MEFSRIKADIPDWLLDDTGSSTGQIALNRKLTEDFLGRTIRATNGGPGGDDRAHSLTEPLPRSPGSGSGALNRDREFESATIERTRESTDGERTAKEGRSEDQR